VPPPASVDFHETLAARMQGRLVGAYCARAALRRLAAESAASSYDLRAEAFKIMCKGSYCRCRVTTPPEYPYRGPQLGGTIGQMAGLKRSKED
jgi:hypothetical protein